MVIFFILIWWSMILFGNDQKPLEQQVVLHRTKHAVEDLVILEQKELEKMAGVVKGILRLAKPQQSHQRQRSISSIEGYMFPTDEDLNKQSK